MPAVRVHFPETLPGATKFSGDPVLNGAVELIRTLKREAWILQPLFDAIVTATPRGGRPRLHGNWVYVAIAFIVSRQGDIQPFYDRASLDLWRECGFDHRPSYSTTHERLTELEDFLPEIEAAIGRIAQHYITVDPRIGRHVHIDGTEAETHSRFEHDCRDDEYCAWRREGETPEDVNKRMLGKTTTESAQKYRQQEDAGEVAEQAEEAPIGIAVVDPGDSHSSGRQRPLYRVRTANHSWLTHDPDAGFRSYRKPNGKVEGWHGFYHLRAVDDFTGLTMYGLVTSSSRTEHSTYEDILWGVVRSMNPPSTLPGLDDDTPIAALNGHKVSLPEAIIGDRGFAYPFIYEMNTRLGILTVAPWRKFADGRDQPTEITLVGHDGMPFVVDRHSVIHCKHCGGPTKQIEFRRAKGETPRLYLQCLLPAALGSACTKLQSVSCDLDWRMLLPLERSNGRYLALESRFQFERAHHMGRVRNRNGAKDPILRPKRLGRSWQQLLLSLANLVDWLRAGLKHGWLPATRETFSGYSGRVNESIKKARVRLEEQVGKRSAEIRRERQEAGLDGCWPPEPEPPPPETGA